MSVSTTAERVRWSIDVRRVSGSDIKLVSPEQFTIANSPFRIMIFPWFAEAPNQPGGKRGQHRACFKASNGQSTIQLKCEGNAAPKLRLRFFVGGKAPRGPIDHDFADKNVCGLQGEDGVWSLLDDVHEGVVTVGVECWPLMRH